MRRDDVRDAVKQAIARVLQKHPGDIADQALLREHLGLDSLSTLEAIVEVLCRFKIPDVPDDQFAGVQTVDQAVRLIENHLQLEVVSP